MNIHRRFLLAVVLLAAVTQSTGCYYLNSEEVPATSQYDLDLVSLRRLAVSIPGALPRDVRLELVATTSLPGALMMAGKSWDGVEMTHVVFQVLRPDGGYLLIDSAQDLAMHESMPGDDPFDGEAWDAIVRAMEGAEQIVITHEHPDHLGGVARHPRPEALLGSLRLTAEQVENVEALEAIDFPTALAADLRPLDYDDAVAIAPGIVLKKSPGHTPGSQMVYVLLESGQELLFVGDVVWNLDALTELRYRPRLITDLVIGENRESAINQLRALRDLLDQGGVDIVVSHDARTHASARIGRGFELAAE